MGRPLGSKKKREFFECRLGTFLKYAAPVEYRLIMSATPKGKYSIPSIELIEAVCFASVNPTLKRGMFKKYLDLFKSKPFEEQPIVFQTPRHTNKFKNIKEKDERNKIANMKRRLNKIKRVT